MIKKITDIISWIISGFVFYFVFNLLFEHPDEHFIILYIGCFLCFLITWISFKSIESFFKILID